MRRRGPEPFAEVLRDAVGAVEPDTVLARVQRAWPDAAGPAIAAQAQPVREREGTVWIACSDAVYAYELGLMEADLIDALKARSDGLELRSLRFEVKSA